MTRGPDEPRAGPGGSVSPLAGGGGEARTDAELERRVRVLRQGAAALLCCVPLYTAFLLAAGAGLSVPTLAVIGSGIAVLPIFPLARRKRHLTLLGNVVVAILWAVLWRGGWHTGGVQAPGVEWLGGWPRGAYWL